MKKDKIIIICIITIFISVNYICIKETIKQKGFIQSRNILVDKETGYHYIKVGRELTPRIGSNGNHMRELRDYRK